MCHYSSCWTWLKNLIGWCFREIQKGRTNSRPLTRDYRVKYISMKRGGFGHVYSGHRSHILSPTFCLFPWLLRVFYFFHLNGNCTTLLWTFTRFTFRPLYIKLLMYLESCKKWQRMWSLTTRITEKEVGKTFPYHSPFTVTIGWGIRESNGQSGGCETLWKVCTFLDGWGLCVSRVQETNSRRDFGPRTSGLTIL